MADEYLLFQNIFNLGLKMMLEVMEELLIEQELD